MIRWLEICRISELEILAKTWLIVGVRTNDGVTLFGIETALNNL